MADSTKRWREAYQAIVAHVQKEGAGNWKSVRERFPDVPEATFWRYVRTARKSEIHDRGLAEARRCLSDHVTFGPQGQVASVDNEPIGDEGGSEIPSVAVGFRNLNLVGHLRELFADIESLRSSALDENGEIERPYFFMQAISMRDRAIITALRCAEAGWDLQKMFDFYDAIVEEVAAVSPDAAKAIMQRLALLSARA